MSSFNSILVRLKACAAIFAIPRRQICFNSILVRLKGRLKHQQPLRLGDVSIPYWFD